MRLSHAPARTLATVLMACVLWSCGGSGDGTPTPPTPTPGTLAVALGSGTASVVAGGTETATVSITRGGSFSGSVTLAAEGAPAGVTATLTPATLGSGVTSSSLGLAVAASTTPGTYPITVRATGTGVTAATATFSLTVTAALMPDFGVSVTPGSLTVQEGGSGTATVAITRIDGFTGDVGMFVGGVPQDVQATVTPNTTTGTTATINISVQLGVPPGSYPLVLNATENGPRTRTAAFTLVVTAQPSLGVLTLNPSTIGVVQGQPSAPITVNIVRGTGITGDAQLTLENLPPFVTGTFTPNPASGAASTLVLNVGVNHPPGTITIRVRATIGTISTTANLLLTTGAFTPPDFALSLTPSSATVTAGQNTSAAVGISRTGSFAGDVAFSVSGAPAGVTATVSPITTSGTTASLDIVTGSGTTPGIYPLVVSATGTGITGPRTANFSLTVNAPASGGNVQWRFCETGRFPVWFGVRSGTSGAWTQVAPGASNTYAFPFAQAGQVAYVLNSTSGFEIEIFNATPTDAARLAANECVQQPARKTVMGSVTNVLPGRASVIAMSGAFTIVPDPLSTFTLQGVHDGPTDLIAMMGFLGTSGFSQFNRVVVRRNINPASGATLPVIDFEGPESFPSAGVNGFYDNVGTDQFSVIMALRTSNGTSGTFYTDLPAVDNPRPLWGLPSAARAAGDLHVMTAVTTNVVSPRQIIRYTSGIASGINTFGPLLSVPTVTVLGNSPVRIRSVGLWQAEYGSGASASFVQSQSAPNARALTINGSREFFGTGATEYIFEIPDFSAAPGWNPIWMLQGGVSTRQLMSAIGLNQELTALTPVDGLTLLTGQRIGTVTP